MERRGAIAIGAANGQPWPDVMSRDLLMAVLQHGPAGIAILNAHDLRVRYINRQFQSLLDEAHHSTSLIGLELRSVLPQPAWSAIAGLIKQAGRSERVATREALRLEGFGRGALYWDTTVVQLQEKLGSSAAVLLQAVDVSSDVHVEAEHERLLALADQRAEQLSAALERITDGVVVVDVDGKVRRINPAGIAMLDLDQPESRGNEERPADGLPADGAGRYRVDLPPLHLSLRGQTVRNSEHSIRRRNGETTWLNVSSVPLYDRHGSVWGAVAGFHDVSERRQLQQLKDDFLAVTAHELRTPVTALLGYTNLMVRRAEQGDWTDRDLHALRMIETQAQRLTQLVNGLIDVSRVQTGTIELRCQRVDLLALVEQAAAALRANVVDHTIEVTGPEYPVAVWGDPRRLDQVISHIIGNALKYSPWGGAVRIRVSTDSTARIAVSDEGIGIPEQALPLLFERFYRAANVDSDRISGLGIGLYLVKELVAAHQGHIDVRSAPGDGTTFEITLPLYSDQPSTTND